MTRLRVPRVESPIAPHTSTPAELKERLEAERAGEPFLLFRDADRRQHIYSLPTPPSKVTVGRSAGNDLVLDWDSRVSRAHAWLEPLGGSWTITDDLSANGSFVNGDRLSGYHRLEDGDKIRVGSTLILFREPGAAPGQETERAGSMPTRAELSDRQRRVLTALCRPCRDETLLATPATNESIAEEVSLSVHAVKSHLRVLFRKFEIEDLPQNKKRAALAKAALRSGLVTERDFAGRG